VIEWIKNLFKKPTPGLQIWGVIEGPILAEDVEDCDYPEGAVGMVLKVSHGKEVFDAEFWFDNLDEAYVIVRHFQTEINPIPLDMKDFEHVR
jgi:hypothetical protein